MQNCQLHERTREREKKISGCFNLLRNAASFVTNGNLFARRNRLENNTEHWGALLLSLRELIEWVIRKDTELTSIGPIGGDLIILQKQQDSFRAFRRQLEERRPVV